MIPKPHRRVPALLLIPCLIVNSAYAFTPDCEPSRISLQTLFAPQALSLESLTVQHGSAEPVPHTIAKELEEFTAPRQMDHEKLAPRNLERLFSALEAQSRLAAPRVLRQGRREQSELTKETSHTLLLKFRRFHGNHHYLSSESGVTIRFNEDFTRIDRMEYLEGNRIHVIAAGEDDVLDLATVRDEDGPKLLLVVPDDKRQDYAAINESWPFTVVLRSEVEQNREIYWNLFEFSPASESRISNLNITGRATGGWFGGPVVILYEAISFFDFLREDDEKIEKGIQTVVAPLAQTLYLKGLFFALPLYWGISLDWGFLNTALMLAGSSTLNSLIYGSHLVHPEVLVRDRLREATETDWRILSDRDAFENVVLLATIGLFAWSGFLISPNRPSPELFHMLAYRGLMVGMVLVALIHSWRNHWAWRNSEISGTATGGSSKGTPLNDPVPPVPNAERMSDHVVDIIEEFVQASVRSARRGLIYVRGISEEDREDWIRLANRWGIEAGVTRHAGSLVVYANIGNVNAMIRHQMEFLNRFFADRFPNQLYDIMSERNILNIRYEIRSAA